MHNFPWAGQCFPSPWILVSRQNRLGIPFISYCTSFGHFISLTCSVVSFTCDASVSNVVFISILVRFLYWSSILCEISFVRFSLNNVGASDSYSLQRAKCTGESFPRCRLANQKHELQMICQSNKTSKRATTIK